MVKKINTNNIINIGLFGKYIKRLKLKNIIRKNTVNKVRFYYLDEFEPFQKYDNVNFKFIFSYGYGKIFDKNFFKTNKITKIYNLHNAYLPFGRGIYPNLWCIIYDKPIGYSIHRINNDKIDSGPLVFRKKVKIRKDDSLKKIFIKIRFELENSFIKILPKILSDKIISIPQFQLKKKGEKNVYFNKKESLNLLKLLPKKWNTDTKELKKIYKKNKPVLFKIL